ncbi:SHOCT domain-containing protein [Vibrio breoganii]
MNKGILQSLLAVAIGFFLGAILDDATPLKSAPAFLISTIVAIIYWLSNAKKHFQGLSNPVNRNMAAKELIRLKELQEKGILTQEEFDIKASLLKGKI